jgi:hypothetical protein
MKRTTLGKKLNLPQGHIIGARWGNIPAKFVRARVVTLTVADHPSKDYWARPFVGYDRRAIEMTILNRAGDVVHQFYLDDNEGKGVKELTVGGANPEGFKILFPAAIVLDASIAPTYGLTTKN